MTTADLLNVLVPALVGGGAVTFVSTLVSGWRTLRAGARAQERETLRDAVRDRNEAEKDRDYWRDVAAGYRWQLREANITPQPADPVQPSERRQPA